MYGQQAGRPGFPYAQPAAYGQPAAYQPPPPAKPPGLPHGMSFSGYGQQGPSAGTAPAAPLPGFDGPTRQRSHSSDAIGTGLPLKLSLGNIRLAVGTSQVHCDKVALYAIRFCQRDKLLLLWCQLVMVTQVR